ncbi:hypothetical protein D3C87_1592420 [compost metagenome]
MKEAKQAVVIAKAEGEHQKAIEIAFKLKKMGLSVEQIAEAKGLTIDEIEKLK